MTPRSIGCVLALALVVTSCIAEPVERSPLHTYPPLDQVPAPTDNVPSSSTLRPNRDADEAEVVTLAKDQKLAGSFRYDIFGPDQGANLPIVVLIHDLDGADQTAVLAYALAQQNIVIAPRYNSPVRGGRFPDPLSAAACALALAADGMAYGGDPERVSVVGYGFGALAAFIVANTTDLYLPPDCEYPTPVVPIRLVAIGGTWSPDVLRAETYDAMNTFMGGTPEQAPASWALLDPQQFANPLGIEMTLLRGANDTDPDVTDMFGANLLAAGWTVSVSVIADNTSRSALTNATSTIAEYLTNG